MKPNVATMELFIFKKHDDSVLIALKETGCQEVVEHTFNLSTGEAEEGGSLRVQGQHSLYSGLQDSQN